MQMTRLAVLAACAALWGAPVNGQTAAPGAGSAATSPASGTTGATGTSGTATTTGTASAPEPVPPGTTTGTSTGTTASPTVPANIETNSPDYRLTVGDKLRVDVYKDAQLSQALQIRPDGKITLPLIGDVQAAGLTPLELRDRLTTALREYVTNPVVTVIVVETVAPAVFVMGEVARPGSIAMTGPMSVMQALAMAGGFKDFADTKNIRILRKNGRGVRTLTFNYKDAVKGAGETMLLAPGDTVVVP